MNFRRLSSLLLVVAAAPLAGQQLSQLPRVAPTTGLADSSLFMCSDSTKALTRACKFSDFQKRLAFKAFDSLVTATLTGGAADMTILCGTGNSRQCILRSTTSGGVATTALRLNAVQQALGVNGANTRPSFAFASDTATGIYRVGSANLGISTAGVNRVAIDATKADWTVPLGVPAGAVGAPSIQWGTGNDGWYSATTNTITLTSNGVRTLDLAGAGSATITGGSGSMTITGGTGSSRHLALRTTTSGGTATTALRFNEAQQSLFTSGSSARPSHAFAADTTTGIYRFGAGEIGFSFAGADVWRLSGSALRAQGALMAGGGSETFPGVTFFGDSTMGLYRVANSAVGNDTLGIATGGVKRLLIANQGATGAGDVALCIKTTGVTGVVTQGAACGTSSAKVKTGIRAILNPTDKVMALRPMSYAFIASMYDGRREYGLLAEATAAVDSTLVFKAETEQKLPNGQTLRKGEPQNVNDRSVLALLTATVQELVTTTRRQQVTIDSLRTVLVKGKAKP